MQPAAGTTTAAVETVPLHDQMVGTWQLEGIDTNAATYRDRPVVRFDDDGTWSGSDGCNGLTGTWRVSDDGTFVADSGFQSLVGCHNVDYAAILNAAARVEIDGDRLIFHARNRRARRRRSCVIPSRCRTRPQRAGSPATRSSSQIGSSPITG